MIGVILAGGSGTRFWPLSRRQRPKQLVELWGGAPMIEHTLRRLESAIGADQPTLVVLGEALLDATRAALPSLPAQRFIVEPCPRNTLPAIALAAAFVAHHHGDVPFGVFPADHHVGDFDRFQACLSLAEERARSGAIVTMGIKPTHPETGYGYIQYQGRSADELRAFPVASFKEKPSLKTAEAYLEAGNFAWNSGIFVMKPSTLFAELGRQRPDMARSFDAIRHAIGSDREHAVIDAEFGQMRSISIDYGIMEQADTVEVIPATFSWSDVGHWDSVDQVCPTCAHGNVTRGDTLLIDTRDSIVLQTGPRPRMVATLGLSSMVVVDTGDAVLVMPRDRAQDVRDVVKRLDELGRDDLL